MKKTFTKAMFMAAAMSVSGLSAVAQDYISVDPVVNPADGYKGGPQGQVQIYWPGVSLQMDSQDKDQLTLLDPSCVEITLNGNPITLAGNQAGGRVVLAARELEGGSSLDDMLTIQFPDASFWWTGNVVVTLNEGAVTSTTGEINKELTLNYNFYQLNYEAIWEPAKSDTGADVTLVAGEAVLLVSWEGCSDLTITEGAAPFYQKATDEDNGQHVSALEYMSIEGGKVKFDFTTFEAGSYILDLPDGAIDLGNGTQNGETIYNFKIVETTVPEAYVSPLPSSYGFFDAFRVIWADNITQPYSLSSQYTSSANSDNLIFNQEGLSLFRVSKDNLEDIEILQVSIVEYQEDEETQNYPNAQLLVTLADFQTEVGGRYTLYIEPGALEIEFDGKKVANEAVTFTFTLQAQEVFELPDPMVEPTEGVVEELTDVVVSWEGVLGGLDLLNAGSGEITVTYNGEEFTGFDVSYSWSSKDAITDGADGDLLVITFDANLENGVYAVNIPEGYVNVSDIEKGTLPNEAIAVSYTLEAKDSGISVISADGALNIYNINGVKVNAKSTENLPAGIYIVNGKKCVVK